MFVENKSRYKINTPNGYVDFKAIQKSPIKRDIFEIRTEEGSILKCTAQHLFVVDNIEKYACEFKIGDLLQSKTGYEKVIFADFNNESDFVYDVVGVDNKKFIFFANNIVSHNCKFLGSASILVDADMLERMQTLDPLDIPVKFNHNLLIYEHPIKGYKYVIGCDSGKGIGSDYSVLQILRIDAHNNVKQVAMYRCNTISYENFAQITVSLAKYYNDAFLMIENNEAGMGLEVAKKIWFEYDYGNMYNSTRKEKGVRSTRTTKLAANMNLKRYIENGWLEIVDSTTVRELSGYEEIRPDIFKAIGKNHDDCVTALIWACYFFTTNLYEEKDIEIKEVSDEYKLETPTKYEGPVFIHDNGVSRPPPSEYQEYTEEMFQPQPGDFNVW